MLIYFDWTGKSQSQRRRAGRPPHTFSRRGLTWIMGRFPGSLVVVLLAPVLWAQQPAPASSKSQARTKSSAAEIGATSDGVYHNPSFGFSYKLPFGWVDRTREMQDDLHPASNDAAKALLLLSVFER